MSVPDFIAKLILVLEFYSENQKSKVISIKHLGKSVLAI